MRTLPSKQTTKIYEAMGQAIRQQSLAGQLNMLKCLLRNAPEIDLDTYLAIWHEERIAPNQREAEKN